MAEKKQREIALQSLPAARRQSKYVCDAAWQSFEHVALTMAPQVCSAAHAPSQIMAALGPPAPDEEPLPLLLVPELPLEPLPLLPEPPLEPPPLPPAPLPEPLPLDVLPPEDEDAATCPPASPPWTVLVLPPQPAARASAAATGTRRRLLRASFHVRDNRFRERRACEVTIGILDREGGFREQSSMLADYGSSKRSH